MEKIRIFLKFSICIFLFSCQKEFSVTTEKEESYAVYSLLNLKDSASYVRINRIYIANDNPGQFLQDPDSVNIRAEDFEVTIQPYLEGNAEALIVLNPSDDYIKVDGLCATQNYQTFKTKQQLLPDRDYRLTVRNILTGYEMHAETDLLGGKTIEDSFKESRFFNINQYDPEMIDYEGDLSPGQWDKRIERFLYYEYSGSEVRMKYVDWRATQEIEQDEIKNSVECQLSDEFLKYLTEEIQEDPSLRRRAIGVDRMLVLNDEALTIFIEYSEDQSSGHYIPVFSNFDKGTGILASRYYYTYFALRLRKITIDSLASGRFTGHLRFADSQGNWMAE
jgi:hypothetical protein